MRRYLCTFEEVQENEQRTKRRRIDPILNEVNVASRSGLEQERVNQKQEQPRTFQNARRGKNVRLDNSRAQIAEYLEKQIKRSNQILAQMEVDDEETEESYEESEDGEEDLGVSHFDIQNSEEKVYSAQVVQNKSVESENNVMLDGYGKPNSEMIEIMARKQQKLAQKKGQGQRLLNQSKLDIPEVSFLPATIVGQATTQMHCESMEVDVFPRGRRSIRGKLSSSMTQDSSKLTPAMQEILARKQQVFKEGPAKKLDQTVSSTTEFISSISTGSQPIKRGTRLGRKSIRDYKSGGGNETTAITEISQQIEDVDLKKGRGKSVQPDTTVRATDRELKTHNESRNNISVTEDVGKLTPAMQEILARKQQKIASKQGQNKKLEETVSSTTENISVVKLQPKVTLEYIKSFETETKTTRYSRSTTENTDKPPSAMQKVLVQKQQQVASKPRKSRKLDQSITSTMETRPLKLFSVQSHIEPETKTKRKSTRYPQQNASGTGDSLYKHQEENEELKKENNQDQLDSVVSENTSKLTPAMKAILARKQRKEADSKQRTNKKLNETVVITTEPVLNTSTDQSATQSNLPAVNGTKSGGRNTRRTRAIKSFLQDEDASTEEKQQTLQGPVKKSRGKKKEMPDVPSSTKGEEPSITNSKTISAKGKRRPTEGLSEDLNATHNVEKPTPAMQQLLEKKQQRALEKSAKRKN